MAGYQGIKGLKVLHRWGMCCFSITFIINSIQKNNLDRSRVILLSAYICYNKVVNRFI